MKRITKILIALVVLLVIARLLLPYFMLRYVNKTLADMGDYTGHVEDIDIQLIRGAYQIDDLRIRKANGQIKVPFLSMPKTDLSVEWKSLFRGKLVSEVETYEPEPKDQVATRIPLNGTVENIGNDPLANPVWRIA